MVVLRKRQKTFLASASPVACPALVAPAPRRYPPWSNRLRPGPGIIIPALMCAVLAAGCVGPRHSAPSVDPSTLADEGFQAYLAEAELVTVEEAYRAMLILADGEDSSTSFEQRRQQLESRGILRPEWNLQPQNVIDVGSVAYMICRVCQIRGGVNFRLFGSWGLGDRRYALRELLYREMIDGTVDYQHMTGAAMITVMAKADELMEKKGLYYSETIDLTDEGDRDETGELIVPPPG